MKILYYERLDSSESWIVHAREVVDNLLNQGHTVVLLSGNHIPDRLDSDANSRQSRWTYAKENFRSLWLFRLLKGEIVLAWLLILEIRLAISAIITILKNGRDFDVIYGRHHIFNSDYFLAKLLGIPSIREVNGILVDEIELREAPDAFSLRAINRIEKYSISKAYGIVVVTAKLKDILIKDYYVSEDKITVILNGANTGLFRPLDKDDCKKQLELDLNHVYVCFSGALLPWQGVEYIVRSAPMVVEKCPAARFMIVGDGVIKNELIDLAKRLGVDNRFFFSGTVPYERVPLYINASDVCVVPKKIVRSGFSPLKLCEYMACEKPVIATRAHGFEILEEIHSGLLVDPGNPEEFANAIVKLLQSPDLRQEMGNNGRQYVTANRSWASVAVNVAEVCQKVRREYGHK
ncbi:glycosyltransferase family 4 protein [Chloroflexota bacterium]